MVRVRHFLASTAFGVATLVAAHAEAVEIEYWQYVFDTRIKAMDQLIERFEAENPDVTVKHTTFPYADYQTKVAAAIPGGVGPDVVQLFYGWLDGFVGAGLLRPLPQDAFPHAEIEGEFFPIVSAMRRDGEYYGLPIAVRSLALFWNKRMFEEAGLDPEKPPQTLDELRALAPKLAQKDESGNLTAVALTLDMAGQDHQWWREVLVRQFGGAPYSDDYRTVTYDSEAGAKALEYYTDFAAELGVSQPGFMDEGQAAFRAGRAAMTIDGTFRLGSFQTIRGFDWGVAELPAGPDGTRSNYASYWANAITQKPEGEELDAAIRFMRFINSPEAMKLWLEVVGELPARREVATAPENLENPIYGPFLKALDYARTTLFVDEQAQRQVTMDMAYRVIMQGQTVAESLKEAAAAEQAIIDRAQ